MSINQLYQAFSDAAEAGVVNGEILPLMGTLVAALGVEQLDLKHGQATQVPKAAHLIGFSRWPVRPKSRLVVVPQWSLSMVGTVDEKGRNILTLTLSSEMEDGKVMLGRLVDDLPHSRIPDLEVGGGIQRGDSILIQLRLAQTRVVVSAKQVSQTVAEASIPHLSGWLAPADLNLGPAFGLLAVSRLVVAGPMNPRADAKTPAKLNLEGVLPLADRTWADKLDVVGAGLRLTTNYDDLYAGINEESLSSAVLLNLQIIVRTPTPHTVTLTVPPMISGSVLDFMGLIDPPLALTDGFAALLAFFPGAPARAFQLPAGLEPLREFSVAHVRAGIETKSISVGTDQVSVPIGVAYTGLTLESNTRWDLPIPFLHMEDVAATWLVRWDGVSVAYWSANLRGSMVFTNTEFSPPRQGPPGKGEPIEDHLKDAVVLDVNVGLPECELVARNRYPFAMSLPVVLRTFFSGPQPKVGKGLVVDSMYIRANLAQSTLHATLQVQGDWAISAGNIKFQLEEMDLTVTLQASAGWGGLSGRVLVKAPPPGGEGDAGDGELEEMAALAMGAYYPGDGAWTFQGGLASQPLELITFVYAFIGQPPPAWLEDDPALNVLLTELWAEYSTATGNPYRVRAGLAVRWQPQLLNLTLGMAAATDVVYRKRIDDDSALARHDALLRTARGADDGDESMVLEGSVTGAFTLNNLVITAGVSLREQEQTWLFRVELDTFMLEGCSAYIGAGKERHAVIRVEMQGVTFGELIRSFAALANPNANFRLKAPWTFLDHIHLGHFVLVVDPAKQKVSFDYDIKLHLGFFTLASIGLRYERDSGEPRVNIELTGSFLGKSYNKPDPANPEAEPLGWDALNDSPPEVPGEGDALVDLRYLGLGQHVALSGLEKLNSVADVLAAMREQMKPVPLGGINPLEQPGARQLVFDEGGQWLIGLDLTVLGTVTLQIVLHDPDLYGLLIDLDGERAGVLAGLRFELLYQKVTEDIGVFRGRLQIPKAFRHLNLGAVALTLGNIAVDIYTNGNFKVDLGFPHNRDYSHSFGLTYGAFTGIGGLYFAKLTGATSSKVPAIDNGIFSPVLELGLGLAVRCGRTIKQGPLEASLLVQLEVVFEGVLAWFNPDDVAAGDALYYSAQGMARIVGKLCGKVNLKVMTIDITVDAVASVTLAMEAYRRTLIELSIDVKAHGKVKAGFIKVSCSFEVALDASFIVGKADTPPWILARSDAEGAANGGGRGRIEPAPPHNGVAPAVNASRRMRGRSRLGRGDWARLLRHLDRGGHPLAMLAGADEESSHYRLNFDGQTAVYAGGGIQSLDLRLVPTYTVSDASLVLPGEPDGGKSSAQYQIVMLLTIDGPTPPAALSLDAARHAPFTPTARAETQAETPFAVLAEGLLRWAVSALGLDPQNATVNAGELDLLATQLAWPQTFNDGFSFDNLSAFLATNLLLRVSGLPDGEAPEDLGGVCFAMPPVLGWEKGLIGEVEKRDFATYQPVDSAYAAAVAAGFAPLSPAAPEIGDPDRGGISAEESLGSVVFRDYLLLVTKTIVQAAQNLMTAFPVALDGSQTLSQIAARFPSVTLPYVVRAGDTSDQVAAHYGLSEEALLALNPDLPDTLAGQQPGQEIAVCVGVTPESIAAGNPDWALGGGFSLAAPALQTQVQQGDSPQKLCARLGADPNRWLKTAAALDAPITRVGAPLTVAGFTFANPTKLDLNQVAALTYVRFHAGLDVVTMAPRVNWYAAAVTALNGTAVGADGALPETILVPAAYNGLAQPPLTWMRLVGDTLGRLAAVTALSQYPDADPLFAAWRQTVIDANPHDDGRPVLVPQSAIHLLRDETLRDLAARLLHVDESDMTGLTSAAVPDHAFLHLIGPAPVLAPLAPVVVTDCILTTETGKTTTVRDFAAYYDLTLESVGRIGADTAGWFQAGATPLTVPHLPAVTLDALMPQLLQAAPIRDIGGQVSRFMLHGQRLPVPGAPATQAAMYELIGQQFPGPATHSILPFLAPRVELLIKPTQAVTWLTLVNSESAKIRGDRDAALSAYQTRFPGFADANPAAARGALRDGMVLDMGDRDEQLLSVVINEGMLARGYPSKLLKPKFYQAPASMPAFKSRPTRHGLPYGFIWNTPQRPHLSDDTVPAVGMPSLWPLTPALRALARRDRRDVWRVYRSDPALGPDAPAALQADTSWATRIAIKVNRVPGSPHVVDVVGADLDDRKTLLALWRYLADQKHCDDADLWFGFPRSPAAGLAAGLSSPVLDRDDTFIVRTNLASENHAHKASDNGARPSPRLFFASMTEAGGFLTLLWQACVFGGGGFWLQLRDLAGHGFPEDLFDNEGRAEITLVALLHSQAGARPLRRLFPFTNVALVGVPVDPAATALFVAAPDGDDLTRTPMLAPGSVGFTMVLHQPVEEKRDDQARTRCCYNLAGYRLRKGNGFTDSGPGRAVGPQVLDREDDSRQTIAQVIPIHRFARSNVPTGDDLPPAEADPYAGIAIQNGAPANATVELYFQDFFGNRSGLNPGQGGDP